MTADTVGQPQDQSFTSQFTINLTETVQAGGTGLIIKAQNLQEITDFIQDFEHAAAATNNLFKIQLNINGYQARLLLTADLDKISDGVPFSTLSKPADNCVNEKSCLSSVSIKGHVKRALKDYHSLNRLSKNPLTKLLNLDSYQLPNDNPLTASGIALRRLLDQVLDAISGLQSGERISLEKVRLEYYLALRYREGISHSDLSIYIGYADRHLQRLHNELITEAAELMISHQK